MNAKRIAQLGILAVFVVLLIYAIYLIQSPRYFPIVRIQVEAPFTQLSKQELQALIAPEVERGFFAVRVVELQQQLERLPWVQEAKIYRVWPDSIKIKLQERQARFRWRSDGLISERGVLFYPKTTTTFEYLPYLSGPIGFETKVLQKYENMSKMLNEIGLSIVELSLSDRLAWSLTLDNGMVVLVGRREPLKRLQRLVVFYDRLTVDKARQPARVDLRYPHGMAVRWTS